jgi:Cu(I)/Ag(I) efflux system membrane fusion protein
MMRNKKQLLIYTALIIGGVLIGWMIFGGNTNNASKQISITNNMKQQVKVWTCSMHPQIRKDDPGKCPICAMDLIPLNNEDDATTGDNQIQLSESAMKIAEVQTYVVQKAAPIKEIRLSGKIKPDERKVEVITARFAGRIEKLFVNFTGQQVQKGEKLATVYSPDLITAQKELFEATKFKKTNPEYYKAAKNKLKLWSLSDKQIESIEQNGEPQNYFDIISPLSGTVLKKEVALGDYLEQGTLLFKVADLTTVWALFDAYESDLPWIRINDKVTFELQSQPGKQFSNSITFIDPVVNIETRVAAVRTEMTNSDNLLKPEMFVKGLIQAKLPNIQNALLIPKSSVLWTGKTAVVYVRIKEQTKPTFEYREIRLGEDAGNFYVVKEGLNEYEEIVTNGVFKIDAAAQLAGKQSMMNIKRKKDSTDGHAGMDMSSKLKGAELEKSISINSAAKEALQPIFKEYLLMKNALTADDFSLAKKSAITFQSALSKIEMSLFTGTAHTIWMKHSKKIKEALNSASQFNTIEEVRKSFQTISKGMIGITISLKPYDKPIYVEFCPMANENKGADWMSLEKEIKNPYLGKAMLTCGEVKQEIK